MSKDVKQTKGLTRLHSLTAAEVSLVPTGANKRRFLILKNSRKPAEAIVGLAQRVRDRVREKVLKTDPAVMGKVRDLIQRHRQGQTDIDALGNQDGKDGPVGGDIQHEGDAPGMLNAVEGEDAAEGVTKDTLDAAARDKIAPGNFAVPPDKYPIHDESHARNALARASGKPEEAQVKAAVHRKYPHIGAEEQDNVRKDGGQNDMDGYGDMGQGGGSGGGGLGKQAEAALQAVVRILTPFKDEIPSDLLNDVLEVGGFKSPPNAQPGVTPAGTGKSVGEHYEAMEKAFEALPAHVESEENDFLEGVTKGHMMEASDEAEKCYKAHLEKLGYQKYPMAKMCMKRGGGAAEKMMGGESVSKSGSATPGLAEIKDPHTRRVLEAVQKSNLELVKKNADLEKSLADQRAAERKKEIVLKASSFKHLGIPETDLVDQLMDADKLGAVSYERVVKSFATLNAQAEAGKLFGEFGTSRGSEGGGDDLDAKIKQIAAGIVEKSGGTTMTPEQAYAKALESPEGQRLYAQYKTARPHGI